MIRMIRMCVNKWAYGIVPILDCELRRKWKTRAKLKQVEISRKLEAARQVLAIHLHPGRSNTMRNPLENKRM